MKIYTKNGDKGETQLLGGTKVSKDNVRLKSYGSVDELNAYIGHIFDHNIDEKTNNFTLMIQNRLFDLGCNIAYDQKNKMVSIQKISPNSFGVYIKPNSSLTGTYRVIFISSIAFICLGIATIFYLVGATLILPFAGLEISILLIAFYLNFRWSGKREKIFLSKDKVIVEKGIHKAEYRWEEFRTFTSFQISKDINKVLKLSFRSKGEDVEIGSFLNDEEKVELKENISKIIEDLNANP